MWVRGMDRAFKFWSAAISRWSKCLLGIWRKVLNACIPSDSLESIISWASHPLNGDEQFWKTQLQENETALLGGRESANGPEAWSCWSLEWCHGRAISMPSLCHIYAISKWENRNLGVDDSSFIWRLYGLYWIIISTRAAYARNKKIAQQGTSNKSLNHWTRLSGM